MLCSRPQLLLLSPRTRARASLILRPGLGSPRCGEARVMDDSSTQSEATRGSPRTTSQNSLPPTSRSGSGLGRTDTRLHFPECLRETTATAPPPEAERLPSTLSFYRLIPTMYAQGPAKLCCCELLVSSLVTPTHSVVES